MKTPRINRSIHLLSCFLLLEGCRTSDPVSTSPDLEFEKYQAAAQAEICGEYELLANDDQSKFNLESPYSFDWLNASFLDRSKVNVGYERIDSFQKAKFLCLQIAPFLMKENELLTKKSDLDELESELQNQFVKEPSKYSEEVKAQLLKELSTRKGWIETTEKLYKSWDSLLLQLGPLGKPYTVRLIKDQRGQTLAAVQLEAEAQACRIESFLLFPALHWPSAVPTPTVNNQCRKIVEPIPAGLIHVARELKEIHGCESVYFTPNSKDTPTRAFVDAGFVAETVDSVTQYKANADSLILSVNDEVIESCEGLDWGTFSYKPIRFRNDFDGITSILPHSER